LFAIPNYFLKVRDFLHDAGGHGANGLVKSGQSKATRGWNWNIPSFKDSLPNKKGVVATYLFLDLKGCHLPRMGLV
jgi:hypothetical protein